MSDQSLEDICHWIDKYTISRVKKNLNRDFSDAGICLKLIFSKFDRVLIIRGLNFIVPLAEMLKIHYPKQVDLHNYIPTTSFPKKMTNWEVLNRKVLQRMRINLSKQVMQELSNSKPGAIEALLKTVKKAVEKDNEKRVLDVENARYRGHVYRVPICNANGNIEYRELVKASIVEDKNRELNQRKGDIENLQQEIVHLQNLMKLKDEKISFLSNKVTGFLKPALTMANTRKGPKTPNSPHSCSSNEEVASI